MKIALMGDVLLTRELGNYGLQALEPVARLLRGCDVAIANLETVLHGFEYPPAAESGGTWLRCPPAAARELAEIGLSAVSRANNHSGDWGVGGMTLTGRALDEAGIVHAGTGIDAYDALAPRYLTNRAGRLALISVTTSSPLAAVAGRAGCGVAGRPGVAYLPISETYEVPGDDLQALQRLCAGFSVTNEPGEVVIGSQRFVAGTTYARRSFCQPRALKAATLAVRQARSCADVVVAAVHSHQHRGELAEPSEALVELCHALIDAGADVVACHGPHVLRGVGRHGKGLVLYGLGNFVFQPDTNDRLPPDARDLHGLSDDAVPSAIRAHGVEWASEERFWQSTLAVCEIGSAQISAQFTPVTIRHGGPACAQGLPEIAEGPAASRILDHLAKVSQPFGTTITDDGQIL